MCIKLIHVQFLQSKTIFTLYFNIISNIVQSSLSTILKDNNQAKNKQKLLDFMDKFQLKSQFSESTTKARFQLNHI